MKKLLFTAGVALALVGCRPQQGSTPSDSGVQSGSDRGSSSSTTNELSGGGSSTNRSDSTTNSSSSRPSQPSQTQPNQQ